MVITILSSCFFLPGAMCVPLPPHPPRLHHIALLRIISQNLERDQFGKLSPNCTVIQFQIQVLGLLCANLKIQRMETTCADATHIAITLDQCLF